MNKPKDNEKLDDDILRSREDIMRAKDIMPPFDKKTPFFDETKDINEIVPPLGNGNIRVEKTANTSPAAEQQEEEIVIENINEPKAEIPRFDLAEEIMAQQRKVTAEKRRFRGRPNVNIQEKRSSSAEPQVQFVARNTHEEEKLIREIVARDIANFLNSN
jgi:hypothetical protein